MNGNIWYGLYLFNYYLKAVWVFVLRTKTLLTCFITYIYTFLWGCSPQPVQNGTGNRMVTFPSLSLLCCSKKTPDPYWLASKYRPLLVSHQALIVISSYISMLLSAAPAVGLRTAGVEVVAPPTIVVVTIAVTVVLPCRTDAGMSAAG